MNIIYNLAVNTINGVLSLYTRCLGNDSQRKFSRFLIGRRKLTERVASEMSQTPRHGQLVWIHASSLGEYAVARPLIKRMKQKYDCTVVLTFFSPTGYEALRDKHTEIDHLFYLPIDTKHHACEFLDAVRPDRAVFIISEFWPNFLQQLKFRGTPTYLVSAIIRDNSPFFKWYGKTFRKTLSAFNRIFVLNEKSRFNLNMLGYQGAELSGDPLFDNASFIAATTWHDPVADIFSAGHKVFIAGSVNDDKDAELVNHVVNSNPELRCILVPHAITSKDIDRLRSGIECGTVLYSQCKSEPALAKKSRVLIVDCIGKLAYLYRYATAAYIGGGFTPLLHSVIEATVYGIPVAFGPRIERKVTPQHLIEHGIGQMVKTPQELNDWVTSLINDDNRLSRIKDKAMQYIALNTGSTEKLVKTIMSGL